MNVSLQQRCKIVAFIIPQDEFKIESTQAIFHTITLSLQFSTIVCEDYVKFTGNPLLI